MNLPELPSDQGHLFPSQHEEKTEGLWITPVILKGLTRVEEGGGGAKSSGLHA